MTDSTLPLVSVVLPVYNEAALLRANITEICRYLISREDRFRWELLIVNDGSADDTRAIANQLAEEYSNVRAIHHPTNFGVGQALRFGFSNTTGDYVVTMDVDLSYDVMHIEEMVAQMQESNAKIVLASPYMSGGTIKNVPATRKIFSILGNRFLKFFSQGNHSTLTSMVRVYDGPFVRALDLRSMGLDLMPETLYKAMILRAKIVETPGRLDWGPQLSYGSARTSSMRIIRHVYSTVLSGFAFRPMFFFILPGMMIGLFATYVTFWMFAHYFDSLHMMQLVDVNANKAEAFAQAYKENPHTYVMGLTSIILSLQLLGLGVLSAQNKKHYEDLYHLNASKFHLLKNNSENKK